MEMEPSWPCSSGTAPNGSVRAFESGSKRQHDVFWLREELGIGQVQAGHGCWEWLVKISQTHDGSRSDSTICSRKVAADRIGFDDPGATGSNPKMILAKAAELADALSLLNVRSRGRRQNTAAMIQEIVSRND